MHGEQEHTAVSWHPPERAPGSSPCPAPAPAQARIGEALHGHAEALLESREELQRAEQRHAAGRSARQQELEASLRGMQSNAAARAVSISTRILG